jgi:hypothetical protein
MNMIDSIQGHLAVAEIDGFMLDNVPREMSGLQRVMWANIGRASRPWVSPRVYFIVNDKWCFMTISNPTIYGRVFFHRLQIRTPISAASQSELGNIANWVNLNKSTLLERWYAFRHATSSDEIPGSEDFYRKLVPLKNPNSNF